MDLLSLAPVGVDASASGSPCAGGCGCPAGGGASEVMAKVSLEAGDAGEVTPDIPAGPVDLETLLEHAAVQLSHQQHLPLSARHKIRSLLAQYDASTGELDRYAFFDSGKRYSEAGSGRRSHDPSLAPHSWICCSCPPIQHASPPSTVFPLTVTLRRLGRLTPATTPYCDPAPLPRVHRTPRGTQQRVGDRFTAPPTPCPPPPTPSQPAT
jgi:hypothetical protein